MTIVQESKAVVVSQVQRARQALVEKTMVVKLPLLSLSLRRKFSPIINLEGLEYRERVGKLSTPEQN